MVLREPPECLEHQDHKERQVPQDQLVDQGPQVAQGQLVYQAHQALQDPMETQEILER